MPDQKVVNLCRHCKLKKGTRARGLCWCCFYTEAIRNLYPPTSIYSRKGVGLGTKVFPSEPTTAPPGSPEKVSVLEHRAMLNQELWHPQDANYEINELRLDNWPTEDSYDE